MTASYYPRIARYVAGTAILSTVIAAAITVYGPHGHGFGENLVYSQCIGLLTYATIDWPRRTLWPQGGTSYAALLLLALLAAPVGWFGGSFVASLLLGHDWHPARMGPDAMIGFLALTAGAGIGGCFFFLTRERLAESERTAAQARLKLLQAQVEPHFLFNTLANLQALIALDPKRAQVMLGHLDGYLRATLATTRSDHGTLADEFALLRGYLEILAIRMGPRLAHELDLPQDLARASVPPMLLQPLVENAIKHGLEPKVEGGSIRVSARAEGRTLVLAVEDTGLGFGSNSTAGSGIGLSNVRERLAALYGAAGTLETGENPGGGACVTLRLPLQT